MKPPSKIWASPGTLKDPELSYRLIQTQILDEFGADKVTVSGEEVSKKDNPNDPKRGTFKVTVNGTVVHSKKDGDGHVDSDEKVEKIFNAIQKALE